MERKKNLSDKSIEDLQYENKELRKKLDEITRIQKIRDKRVDQEYQKKYNLLLNNIADPVFIYDAVTYKFLHCNQAALRTYKYSYDEVLQMTLFDLHLPEDYGRLRKIIDHKDTESLDTFTHITKERRQLICEMKTQDIYMDEKPAWMVIIHDLTERKRMEEELHRYQYRLEEMVNERTLEVLIAIKKLKQEINVRKKAEQEISRSERKFRSIIEKSLDGIILIDEQGAIIEWNTGQENIYGLKREGVVGKKIWDIEYQCLPTEKKTRENLQQITEKWDKFFHSGINPFQNNLQVSTIMRPDGQFRDIQQLYFTIATEQGAMMASTTRDITNQLNMEKQLIQSQKMEALGTLAGGIAHDFNNILSGIIGYAELARRNIRKRGAIKKHLEAILTGSKRATKLVKQILTFSRSDRTEKQPTQIGLIVKEAIRLLDSTLPDEIEIVSKIDAEGVFILADPTQIHQVIMNLGTNSAHAMKEGGGIIEIKLGEEELEAGLYEGLYPGKYVRISISDTGHGIKPEILDRIYEPFFTTKEASEGTGMGLAVVHGIVTSHGGHISVYSRPGAGTTFSILLPTTVEVIHKKKTRKKEIPGGSESILLVEDDGPLATAMEKLLEELKYKVTVLNSGVEALEFYQKASKKIHLVITDYSMPKMNGLELIRRIRKTDADIPIIMCTGYYNVVQKQITDDLGIGDVIIKPIDLQRIANSIRSLLDH